MQTLLVTRVFGFIDRNLLEALRRKKDIRIVLYTAEDNEKALKVFLQQADIIYHLAGVNRPESVKDYCSFPLAINTLNY